jgi:prevent-host-death family protein
VVNVHQAKTHLSRLIERTHQGEEIILAKAGKPYARLVPLESSQAGRVPGLLKGLFSGDGFLEPLPEEELRAWRSRTTGILLDARRHPRADMVAPR